MAQLKNNDSYEKCIKQLHARYDGRGVAANAAAEVKKNETRELSGSNAYLVARLNRGDVSDKYRNGEFNGQKYMTTGDFLKYYNAHKTTGAVVRPHQPSDKTKEFRKPAPTVKATAAVRDNTVTERPAVKERPIKQFDENAETIVMPAIGEKKKMKNRLMRLFEKWFPAESKSEKSAEAKRRFPVAAVGMIISASVAMTLIVGTTVLVSSAQTELSDVKYEIKLLEKEKASLEEEIVKKDDLAMINDYAVNKLGMIRKDYVSSVYMEIGADDSADAAEDVNSMGTILSAMFGN